MKPVRKLRRALVNRLKRIAAMPRRVAVYGSNKRRSSDGPPIFIVGCPRSGTTLMRQILDSHSRIACPGETWFLIGMLEQLRNSFFVRGLEGLDVQRPEAVANIRAFALNYYEGYLYRSGKYRWADKTPGYVEYCHEILEVFGPDVRFVYMLRHGMDVANSMQDRDWLMLLGPGLDARSDALARLQVGAQVWMRMTDAFETFRRKHPANCYTVRFEELTRDPETNVRKVLNFLEEPWEPKVMDYGGFPHPGNGDPKTAMRDRIVPNSAKYLSWPALHRTAIRDMLAAHLTKYGYDA